MCILICSVSWIKYGINVRASAKMNFSNRKIRNVCWLSIYLCLNKMCDFWRFKVNTWNFVYLNFSFQWCVLMSCSVTNCLGRCSIYLIMAALSVTSLVMDNSLLARMDLTFSFCERQTPADLLTGCPLYYSTSMLS